MANKDFILAFNFKSNLVDKSYLEQIKKNKNMIFFPSMLQVESFIQSGVNTGCQDVSLLNQNCTGEITVSMLKNDEVRYCIVGHSERRKFLLEKGALLARKIGELIDYDITPVLCIGEAEKMNFDKTKEFLASQIDEINQFFDNFDIFQREIILAYEPVFAIGSGQACDKDHIKLVVDFLKENYNFSKVLYGGSVNETNCEELSQIDCLDGFLIGGASLNSEKVNEISKKVG